MKTNDYEKAIKEIQNNYDAFYIKNKYGEGTHEKEFTLLNQLATPENKVSNALLWIKECYDCYYKDEYDNKESAFSYLYTLIIERKKNETKVDKSKCA